MYYDAQDHIDPAADAYAARTGAYEPVAGMDDPEPAKVVAYTKRPALRPAFPAMCRLSLPDRQDIEFWEDAARFRRQQWFVVPIEDRDHLVRVAWQLKALLATIYPDADWESFEPWVVKTRDVPEPILELRPPRRAGEKEYAVYADDFRYAMPL